MKMYYRSVWIFIIIGYTATLQIGCKSKSVISESGISPDSDTDIQANIRIAEVDNLDNIYIVDTKNRLIKYDRDFKEVFRYANNKCGQISSVDVSNPLKITLFYDDFNQIKVVDNTLSVIESIDLSPWFLDISACGTSNDGNLWLYDPIQFALLKMNDQGKILATSGNVNDFGMSGIHVAGIRENGNYVVICDRNKGFYFFDNFGHYIYHFTASGIHSFQFDGNKVIYYTATGLKTFSIQSKTRHILSISELSEPAQLKYILYSNGYYYGIYPYGLQRVVVQ